MKKNVLIKSVEAIEILDSRGNPTLQVEVLTEEGICGMAQVPSGASTGSFEAVELRDGEKNRYQGKGVTKAVENVNKKISKKIMGMNVFEQRKIDEEMIRLDDTLNKSNLGANAILGVSLAVAKAASNTLGMELYRYIGGIHAKELPVPMMNILNGGKHSENNISIQEFMIMPIGDITFAERLRRGAEIYHTLKKVLKEKGYNTNVGDEGGFAPNLKSNREALDVIVEAITKANYTPGVDVNIGLDVAASEFYEDGVYNLKGENRKLNINELIEFYKELCSNYPIISIEDPVDEDDWDGFIEITRQLGDKIQLVGDDLFVTNKKYLQYAIDHKAGNAILLKVNQIGTITETLETIALAKKNGYKTIISHRSGETEDTTIADLAVGLNLGQIKTGSLSRTDRICKYNQLLRIEEELEK